MAFKKYEADMTITSDEGVKTHVSYGAGGGGFVMMVISSVDEKRITHSTGVTYTAKQAREVAAALVHYAKELEKIV